MPTQYKDLSKSANDLFNKNYEHGKYSLEINHKSDTFDFKTKSAFSNGVISTSHEQTMDRGNNGKHKGTFSANGSGKVAYDSEFKLLKNKNLKVNFLSDYAMGPAANAAFFKEFCAPKELKINFSNEKANLDLSAKFSDLKKVNGALVLDNIPKIPAAVGAKFALNFGAAADSSVLSSLELAVNKKMGPAEYNLFFNPLTNAVNFSLFNKINNDVKLASIVSHNKDAINFGLAGAINGAAAGSSHQFKIDQAGVLAVSHITPTNFGPKLTVSAEFNALKVEDGAKVGAGLKFDL